MNRLLPLGCLLLASCAVAPRTSGPVPTNPGTVPIPEAERVVAEPVQWTLADCLGRARSANHDLLQAERAVAIARSGIDLARSAFFPRIEAAARWDNRSNDPGARMNGIEQVTSERAITSAGVTLRQPIWDSGNAMYQVRAGRARLAAVGERAAQARLDLDRAVVEACVTYQDAHSLVEVMRDGQRSLGAQVRVARDRFANGLAGKEEVLSAELALNERDQDAIQAEHAVELARCALNRLLARPGDARLELAQLPVAAAVVADAAEAERLALADRPDVRAAAHAVAAAEADVEVALTGHLPQFGLMAAYDTTSNSYMLHRDWWSVGVGVQLSLTDGGATSARVEGARLSVAQARDALAAIRDAAAFDARRAWLAWDEAWRRQALAAAAVQLAEENLRISEDRYRQGLISSSELAGEEERRTRARTAVLRVHAATAAATAALCRAIGRPIAIGRSEANGVQP